MTLEELKKTVVAVKLSKNIVVGDDMLDEDLVEILNTLSEDNYSDSEILDFILYEYYSANDIDAFVDPEDYIISIKNEEV